jgi:MFS family permease
MTPDSDNVRHQPSELRQHWGLVAASATLMSISSGVWYAASVVFVALIQEFHWDYGSTAGIFSTFILMYGVWGVLVGLLLDRFGPRSVILAGGVLLPAALASSGLATALPTLYLTHGVITPLGLSLMSYVPVSVLLTRNFYARRGLALGFASAGVGVGILIVVPLTQFLIDRAGWRMAYFGLAAISASVVMCLNGPIQLVLTHQIAHLVEIGHSKILVAGIMGLVGLFSIPGKIWWGYLADRVWPEWIYLTGCAFVVAGIAVLLDIGPVSPLWHLYLYAALMGLGYAVSPAMTPIMCGLFFGGPHFGVIFGALNLLYHAGGASGVWLAGYAHDLTGNYRLPFSASTASATATVLLVWLVAPRRLPVRSAERQAPRQMETTQEPTTENRSASRSSH